MRISLRTMRDAIPAETRATAGQRIAETVAGLIGSRRTVMLFLSFGSEVPTDPLCELLVPEHALVVPHLVDDDIVPVSYLPGEAVVEGVWGIREPADLRPVASEELDAVVAPGLGFDRSGFRIGYGGGFYDRLLTGCRPEVVRIGIAFHEQVVPSVPHGPQDVPMNMLVTEQETIEV